jgi:hypothetical protein
LRGNSFRNDSIKTEHIELAQIAEKICRCFAKVLPRAQLTDSGKLQGAAVSSPPLGDLEIALP